jgi:peptidoglycan/LPS O-acetylase OafA/YrhL
MLASTMLLMMYAGMAAGHRLGLALGLAVLMLGMARWEQRRTIAWPMPLLALGNASYSIYLIHNPLVSVTQRVAGRLGMNWPLALLFGVVLSVGFGYVYFLWVERRAIRVFRSGGLTFAQGKQ